MVSWPDFIIVAVLIAWAFAGLFQLLAPSVVKLLLAAPPKPPKPQPAPDWTPPENPWHALPGGRLKLGATGFAIEHRPQDPRADFFLYNPEGVLAVAVPAGNLAALKQLAERMAGERREFDATVQSFPAFGPRSES
jgi:hypothetical protein